MERRVIFPNKKLPYLLMLPQIIITLIFFIYPALQALSQSFYIEDAFGLGSEFVWLENFQVLFADPHYWKSFFTTILFSIAVVVLSMSIALFLALQADKIVKGALIYRTMMVWPYAVAPAVAGIVWILLFNSKLGVMTWLLEQFGYEWNHKLNGDEAMGLVVVAAAWRQIAYNFIFFLAGLQSIPKSLIEAASIDGARSTRRFWTIIFPLLTPVTFFLIVINVVYAFFDTFGIIHTVTSGGPAGATNIMVYKVYSDGFIGLDLGGSAAQSVVLMVIVGALTVFQFRYMEKKVHY